MAAGQQKLADRNFQSRTEPSYSESAPMSLLHPHVPAVWRDEPTFHRDRSSWILDHKFSVEYLKVASRDPLLEEAGLGDDRINFKSDISRLHLFDMAQDAISSPRGARRLLWASNAWGSGKSMRNQRRIITSVQADPKGIGTILQESAELSRKSPAEAFRHIYKKIKFFGPSFFTKYLYFAGGGDPSHPCLILDTRVAKSLYDDDGEVKWTAFPQYRRWNPSVYHAYSDALLDWAEQLSTPGAPIAPDQIERHLFGA